MRGCCMDFEWLTLEQVGNQWGIKARQVQALCASGQIYSVVRVGRLWFIPYNTRKPKDIRANNGRTSIEGSKIKTV